MSDDRSAERASLEDALAYLTIGVLYDLDTGKLDGSEVLTTYARAGNRFVMLRAGGPDADLRQIVHPEEPDR